ncbi:MAG: hypothetical protein IT305_31350 [Chloroflexi bacterium]|nr:hypothetical protein [Chloroflexota bacterium]
MHVVKASEFLSITSPRAPGVPLAERWGAIVDGHRLPAAPVRRLAVEALAPAVAGVIMSLMVLVGGLLVMRSTAHVVIPPSPSTVDPVTGVDPRDGVVANGWVTPWMERANAPDPSVTP